MDLRNFNGLAHSSISDSGLYQSIPSRNGFQNYSKTFTFWAIIEFLILDHSRIITLWTNPVLSHYESFQNFHIINHSRILTYTTTLCSYFQSARRSCSLNSKTNGNTVVLECWKLKWFFFNIPSNPAPLVSNNSLINKCYQKKFRWPEKKKKVFDDKFLRTLSSISGFCKLSQ